MKHWEENNTLTSSQHGFRANHLCESQLLELTDEITKNLDKGVQTDIVVLDFAKAFDKVNHCLLIKKLECYGISGAIGRWIKDFLSNRSQAVVVDGMKSDTIPVKSGVPQGSVLGPCLFLAYINDLPDHITSNARIVADDTAVDRRIKSLVDTVGLQKDLDSLSNWEKQWDMMFHPAKCYVLRATRARTKIEADYFLHGQKLQVVDSGPYLGVILQSDGEWSKHIQKVTAGGNRLLGFFRRNLKINSKTIKDQAYKMLLRPKLEYASTVWDPYKKDEVNALERIQRRAARIVSNRHRNTSSVGQMIEQLEWPSLEERRRAARLTMLYKIQSNTVRVRCHELQPSVSRSRRSTVSNSRQLERITCTKDYRLHAFFPRTVRQWNSLPESAVAAPSAAAFRSGVLRA